MTREEHVKNIVDSLSWLIVSQTRILASEERAPLHGADQSDDLIQRSKMNITKLREIRELVENVSGEL